MPDYYTYSEEELLWRFERLFRFEFFLRNIQLDADQNCEYEKLKQLPNKIAKMANELLTGATLPEAYPTIDDIIPFVLKHLQFGKLPDLNEVGFDTNAELDKIMMDLCKHFKSNHEIQLTSDFYYFSDLVNANDIKDVIWWWDRIRHSEIKKADRLEGNFGTIERNVKIYDGKKEKKLKSHLFEFNTPDSFKHAKNNNYSIFETTEITSHDNKQSGTRSLLLSVSLEEEADNLDSILEEFRAYFCSWQSDYNLNLLQSGHIPTFEPPQGKKIMQIITEKRMANEIVSRVDSIDKYLKGLLCYDLYKSGKKIMDAATEVESLYNQNLGSKPRQEESDTVENIVTYYNDTRKHIKDIRHTLAEL